MENKVNESLLETLIGKTQQPVNMADDTDSCEYFDKLALPPNWTLKVQDNEKMLPQPRRKSGTINLHDAASFSAYLQRHKIDGQTSIYVVCDYVRGIVHFNAIIDDHEGKPDGQKWREFRATFAPTFSVEWQKWTNASGKRFTQAEFAHFIEDQLGDIAQVDGMPTGAELLEMALSFEAKQDFRFKSAIRLQSGGVQMNLVQDDDEQTISKMKMFDRLTIGVPVFFGGSAYRIDARLRYRVKEGVLTFWYELVRPDRVLEYATNELIGNIKTETQLPIYFGSAE